MKDDQGIPDAVWACTEPESTRYALGAVKVVPRECGSWLAATDGKVLVARSTYVKRQAALVLRDGTPCESVYPKVEDALTESAELPVTLAIRVNCALLAKAQAALLYCSDGVLLIFGRPSDPIRVVGDLGIAAVMPMSDNGLADAESYSCAANDFADGCRCQVVVGEMIS